MKPIIMDMQDMSDSTEVYESRPNPFMIYFIYLIVVILVVAFGWMYFSKIDIVIKSNGIFKIDESVYDVSSKVNGVVTECNVTEGQYVEVGDVLFSIGAEALDETISEYEEMLADITQRIEILNAYNDYLNGNKEALELFQSNKYYEEFKGKKDLLELNIENNNTNTENKISQYQYEVNNATQIVNGYNNQITKLEQVKNCINTNSNNFDSADEYYAGIVEVYLTNYNAKITMYDGKVAEYQKIVDEINAKLSIASSDESESKEDLNRQLTEALDSIERLREEQVVELQNLKTNQLATIEQQIQTLKVSLDSATSNQSLLIAQLDLLKNTDSQNVSEISVLTEGQNVAAEILSYEAKREECENALKQYNMESKNATIKAQTSGYISLNQEMYVGSYIAQGNNVARILPENNTGFYAEIYVENKDIAKLKCGQEVKFEIAAYPSDEYGYFTGKIDNISKDIKVDQTSGSAYYLVKVKCDTTTVTNKNGKTGSIMNGMACQAKIVVDEENVLTYCLRKIDLLD